MLYMHNNNNKPGIRVVVVVMNEGLCPVLLLNWRGPTRKKGVSGTFFTPSPVCDVTNHRWGVDATLETAIGSPQDQDRLVLPL